MKRGEEKRKGGLDSYLWDVKGFFFGGEPTLQLHGTCP